MLLRSLLIACVFAASRVLGGVAVAQPGPADAWDGWEAYGGDAGGTRHAPLGQITPENVDSLAVAWTYRTGDLALGRGRFEATPILVDGTLYLSTPFGRVVALDPATGAERWNYDPRIDLGGDYGDFASRGVATWLDPDPSAGAICSRRIFVAPIDARLIALDGATGALCRDFGTDGVVDLNRDLVNEPGWKGEYQVTSPPAVLRDLVIVGSAIADNQRAEAPSGVVRAFDARTGKLRWRWDPIPRTPDLPGYDTWQHDSARRTGAANAWAGLSVDASRDLVFVPVGSAAPDFYGGERLGQNLYANSVVALRGTTGEIVWHFQVVHHDLWDYDVPAQPVLLTVQHAGARVPALVQATKMGHLFFLHRETGAPLFPVEERPVPPSTVAGEEAWPTQPFPTVPPPLVPGRFAPEDAWGLADEDRAACRARLKGLRAEGIFTPPSLEGTILVPGNIGGSNWSGVATDPARGLVLVPTNNFVTVVRLLPKAEGTEDIPPGARAGLVGSEVSPQRGTPYAMARDFPRAPSGLPCNPPPWSTLAAVDAATGAVRWQVPLGTMPGLEQVPEAAAWGSISLGGVMTTAAGLTFIAGTLDGHLYAFDTETGALRWKYQLPAGAHAAPMSYEIDGRQYVVIAAGGHDRLGTVQGDYVLAFALPRRGRPPEASAPTDVSGQYTGDLIFGARHPVQLDLEEKETSVSGRLRGVGSGMSGTFTATRSGTTLPYELTLAFPEEHCTGTMRGTLQLANGATMLVGDVRLTGSCADEDVENGTMAVRKQ